ncbi:DCC1-like thiol-disulfide oxidoreductase family protein [Corynebacterium freiburgense]|uniref:DCC1-like thiol-disulfide oxidoreductase family protein n=1 Tax=Corynebacterium freiburgense TaxID=556548 RepID=UPI0003FCDE14|nr:DCC1-like thiol-disulfide oxidoreductase family protein [Corynebacterium freiburgense]WJZ01673.1 hypothetical protein CFREI_01845 [Corynebacterium freiburgense]
MSEPVFYFDIDCGFCTWAAEKLNGIADISIVGARSTDSDKPPIVQQTISFAAVFIQGSSVAFGHRAIGEALHRYGNRIVWRIIGRSLLLPCPLWPLGYRLVARYRHWLGPLVGARTCGI